MRNLTIFKLIVGIIVAETSGIISDYATGIIAGGIVGNAIGGAIGAVVGAIIGFFVGIILYATGMCSVAVKDIRAEKDVKLLAPFFSSSLIE